MAQKLFSKLITAASKHKFECIYLGTVDKLKAAQRFYEKRGFTVIDKKDLPETFELCPLDSVFLQGYIDNIKETLE